MSDWVFRFRHSPAAIAATAGGIGLICGALAVAMTSGPPATNSQVAFKQPVETTGAATSMTADPQPVESVTPSKGDPVVKTDTEPKNDLASVSECDQQAWPYITQQCLAERDAGQRKVRVITTDKIAPPVVSAIETDRAKELPRAEPVQKNEPAKHEPLRNSAALAPAEAQPAAPAPEPAAVAVFDPAPTVEAPATPVAPTIETPQVTPVAAPVPVPEPRPEMAATNEKPPKAAAKEARAKNARGTRDKRTREAKSRRAPVPDSDDDDEAYDMSRSRVVERWTEREYVVPSEQGSQRRRVIVIRRNADRGDFFGSSARNYSRSVFQY
jgi:hypothetical protein